MAELKHEDYKHDPRGAQLQVVEVQLSEKRQVARVLCPGCGGERFLSHGMDSWSYAGTFTCCDCPTRINDPAFLAAGILIWQGEDGREQVYVPEPEPYVKLRIKLSEISASVDALHHQLDVLRYAERERDQNLVLHRKR